MIPQFVPSQVCLSCQGCCRFREAHSAWAPCLLEEEILSFVDAAAPAVSISPDKRLVLVPDESAGYFWCPFLERASNKCKVYATRPFECQLYPFLLNVRKKRVVLTVDLNCPYVASRLAQPAFKAHVSSLTELLNSRAYRRLLSENPQIIQAYEDVLELIELDIPHEPA